MKWNMRILVWNERRSLVWWEGVGFYSGGWDREQCYEHDYKI